MEQPVKLIMQWNIQAGREEPYFEFVTQEFPSALLKAGLQLSDAWYTIYGDWPQVMMGFIAVNLNALETFLASETWTQLKQRLLFYIRDYRQKAVPAQSSFQL